MITCLARTAPSGTPQSFTAIPRSPTLLHTTWSPPAVQQQNGQLTGYIIELTEVLTGNTRTNNTSETSFQWDSLHPHYTYRCRVAARTQAGRGPYTPFTIVTMPEAGQSSMERVVTEAV